MKDKNRIKFAKRLSTATLTRMHNGLLETEKKLENFLDTVDGIRQHFYSNDGSTYDATAAFLGLSLER